MKEAVENIVIMLGVLSLACIIAAICIGILHVTIKFIRKKFKY